MQTYLEQFLQQVDAENQRREQENKQKKHNLWMRCSDFETAYRNFSLADQPGNTRAQIRVCTNINGSGDDAFGGAKKWPAVNLHCGFAANASVDQVQSFIDDLDALLQKHGYTKTDRYG